LHTTDTQTQQNINIINAAARLKLHDDICWSITKQKIILDNVTTNQSAISYHSFRFCFIQ